MNGFVRGRPGRRKTLRSGQAVVEFALTAPLLLLLIFGLVDFARAWSAHHAIADAAREGTRVLVVRDPGVGINEAETMIMNRLANARLDPNRATITFEPGAVPARGLPMTVTIEYAYDFWILGPFMNWAAGWNREVNLVSTITMRTE